MKRLLLALLVSLGLQTQAQFSCDSINLTIINNNVSDSVTLTTNVFSLGVGFNSNLYDWDLWGTDWSNLGNLMGGDSLTNYITLDPNEDTIIACFSSDFFVIPFTCYTCDTIVNNNGNWEFFSMQQVIPFDYCDTLNLEIELIADPTAPWSMIYYLNGISSINSTAPWGSAGTIPGSQFTIENLNVSPPCPDWYAGNNISVTLPTTIYDTLKICWNLFIPGSFDCTICDTLVWNNNMSNWDFLPEPQPYFCCDSITYWIDQSQGFNIGLDTTGMVHNPDSMTVYWGVCTGFATAGMCYTGQGMYDYFPQITVYDTVKVAYDVYIYENGSVEICSIEDWLVFDQNSFSWVLLNIMPTSINEITFNKINDDKIYDMLGKEIIDIPLGTIYIRNNQKFIRLE